MNTELNMLEFVAVVLCACKSVLGMKLKKRSMEGHKL